MASGQSGFQISLRVISGILLLGTSSCITPNTSTSQLVNISSSPSPSPSPSTSSSTTVTLSGARAVKILFQAATGGSFDAPTHSGGTVASPGSGHPAVRIFNPDNSLLASGGSTSSSWPKWLTSFEIGISGSLNTGAQTSSCARFADSAGIEAEATNCNLGNPSLSSCGAPPAQFRVSEADCKGTGIGTGASSDPIYFRAVFNRDSTSNGLASTENIMVVLEYVATSLLPAPTHPTSCLSNGVFSPENCADFTWRAFLKHSATETTQPFLLLVPPTFSSVLIHPVPTSTPIPTPTPTPYPGGGASTLATKQFILPLAADPLLTTLQISRTGSKGGTTPLSTYLKDYCNPNNNSEANTPLCSGMVFYSLTLYRI